METIIVVHFEGYVEVTLNRLKSKNSLNLQLLKEIHLTLDMLEDDASRKVLLIQGLPGLFSSGMDLQEMAARLSSPEKIREWSSLYIATLDRFRKSSKIIVTLLDGKTFAGGVGLVAASDYVIATTQSQFKLTELCWGLLPSMVAPFLIRRIGLQKCYELTLTHRTLGAAEAAAIGLVDQLTENQEQSKLLFLKNLSAIDIETLKQFKEHFHQQWGVSLAAQQVAIDKTTELLQSPLVQKNIRAFVEHQTLPWTKQ